VFSQRSATRQSTAYSSEIFGSPEDFQNNQTEQTVKERLAIAKREEIRRKEEALLIEKGTIVKVLTEVRHEDKKRALEDGWKYLFQHLFEDCIAQNTKDNPMLLETTVRMIKMLKEFRTAAEAHVKQIIDELPLAKSLRASANDECKSFYGSNLTPTPSNGNKKEVPTMMTITNENYSVKIGISKSVDGGLMLMSKGLDTEVIEDDMVSLCFISAKILSLSFSDEKL
jgi:hypothetical protein